MNLNIQRGRVLRPQRVVIYAPEGLGKSTLASQLEEPIFLDFEKGTHHLDVARLEPTTLVETLDILAALTKDPGEFKTLVIDTIDWLEELVIQDVCKTAKKSGIEDFGYGKGWVVLAERFNELLVALNAAAERMHVVLLAHSHVKRLELPETPPFDHYELKLSKHVAPLVREWCDALLFGNWRHVIKSDDSDKTKATKNSGKDRVLRCKNSSVADAKNRHELGEEEPWSLDTMGRVMARFPRTNAAAVTPAPAPAPIEKQVEKMAREKQGLPVGHVNTGGEADGIPGISPESGGPPAAVVIPPALAELFAGNEEAVNAFLRTKSDVRLSGEQTWRDMPSSYVARIEKNPVAFLRACGVKEVSA